jgi:hypothetical protein
MSGRMDWRRARLSGRPTLNVRDEEEQLARADRWRRARRRNAQGGQHGLTLAKPVPASSSPTIYRARSAPPDGGGCIVTIIELPQAKRYREVFAFLQAGCPPWCRRTGGGWPSRTRSGSLLAGASRPNGWVGRRLTCWAWCRSRPTRPRHSPECPASTKLD